MDNRKVNMLSDLNWSQKEEELRKDWVSQDCLTT